jgi:hypothetical protein
MEARYVNAILIINPLYSDWLKRNEILGSQWPIVFLWTISLQHWLPPQKCSSHIPFKAGGVTLIQYSRSRKEVIKSRFNLRTIIIWALKWLTFFEQTSRMLNELENFETIFCCSASTYSNLFKSTKGGDYIFIF